MSDQTLIAPSPVSLTSTFEIVTVAGGYAVTRDGSYLTDARGVFRTFVSRNAARKRISRERTGNFHK